MLCEKDVIEIYMTKLALRAQSREDAPFTNKMQAMKGQSVGVSVMYGVTSRTIRDIWNRHSWAYATRHLWHLEPQLGVENSFSMLKMQQDISADYRRPGRPKGSRDRIPRKKISKNDASIRHNDSLLDEEGCADLKPCGGDRTHGIEEIETAEEMEYANMRVDCTSAETVSFIAESAKDDPFHADWPFW
jgi:hypothetical protein